MKIKILVIDDDDVDRIHIKRSMVQSGFEFELTEETSADTALTKLDQKDFDCIFLDYLLPKNNGLVLLKQIREKGIRTPIVIVTSQGSESIAVDLMKAGASDYIVKSQINGPLLGQIIKNILRIRKIEIEKENAVQALKLSEARLAEAQRIAKVGSFEIGGDNSSYWSDEIYSILELPKDGPLSIETYLKHVHADDLSDLVKDLQTAWDGAYCTSDHRVVTISGMIRHVHAQGVGKFSEKGDLIKIIGTIQDITARKQSEQEILHARELAANSLKVREVFLANMSHEIRTPMNAIVGFIQLLSETQLTHEQRSFLDAISFSSENLLVIIDDILDLSKIKSGKMHLEKVEFGVEQTVTGVVNALKRKSDQKGLQLRYNIEAGVPTHIMGDPVRLNQVLTNLISNAIKFTREGYVHVQVSVLSVEENVFLIEFSVEDTGIGIEEHEQSNIFESFVQASGDTTRNFGGTGLGLTIVKSIVELHGGHIHLESTYGKGSVFKVRVPYQKAAGALVKSTNLQTTNDGSVDLMRHASILLAEDNHVNQILVKRVLDKVGCVIDIAENGAEAVERIKSGKYDLVLMDIQMPEMDGYAATRQIRKNLPFPLCETPIIAMTAHALSSEVEKCLNAGMNDYISKPFKQEVFFSKIVKQLKNVMTEGIIPLHKAGPKGAASNEGISISAPSCLLEHPLNCNDPATALETQASELILRLRGALEDRNAPQLRSLYTELRSCYSFISVPELSMKFHQFEALLARDSDIMSAQVTNAINELLDLVQHITEGLKRTIRKTG